MEETKNRSEKNLCCEVDYYLYRFRLGRTLCSKMFCLGVFFAVFLTVQYSSIHITLAGFRSPT